jgi:hypothetical protein
MAKYHCRHGRRSYPAWSPRPSRSPDALSAHLHAHVLHGSAFPSQASAARAADERFYIGEVVFKGEILKGGQSPIIDRDLFDTVQAKLKEQRTNHTSKRMESEALLIGRIFDNRGNRMSPSHARKRGIKYRSYVSSVLLNGIADRAGSMDRIAAEEIERLVTKSVRGHLKLEQPFDDRTLIDTNVSRVEIQSNEIVIHLAESEKLRAKGLQALDSKAVPHRLAADASKEAARDSFARRDSA